MNRGLCKDRIGVQFIKIKCMEISSSIFILPLLLYLTKKRNAVYTTAIYGRLYMAE